MSTFPIQTVLKHTLLQSKAWTPFTCSVRWKIYGPIYLDPTLDRDELGSKLPEDDVRRYQPIKAAMNEQSTSLNYDYVVQKFIRMLTKKGKKELARGIADRTFANIKFIQLERYNKAKTDEARAEVELNPVKILHAAVENCKPLLITERISRGGVAYQVPIPVKPNYAQWRSLMWLIDSTGKMGSKEDDTRVWVKLAHELLQASQNEGKSIRKKQELHKLCEANRAYAHFRWT